MGSIAQHRRLVARLEHDAQVSPGAYKMRVALLAALGFGVLGLSLVLALGVSVGLVVTLIAISPILLLKLIKIIWIPLALGWMVLRALWIRFTPPDGHRLAPGEAPLLQAEVERIRVAAGAPRLHGIYIDGDLNAAACMMPRALGLFGHRHYLVLGLPLMQALDRDQFAAVVAHEFGHFGGGHGRFSGWIYRVRLSWYRLLEALHVQRSWFARLFSRFFEWYAPYFNAYSFALARQQEFEADNTAARIAGRAAIGQALVRMSAASHGLQGRFWPGLDVAMRAGTAPPDVVHRDIAAFLRTPVDDAEALAQRILSETTSPEDTHPALAVRLQSLGVDEVVIHASAGSAAQALLGDFLPTLEAELSAQWRAFAAPMWEEVGARCKAGAERLVELEAKAERTADEHVEYARIIDELRTPEDAIAAFRIAVAANPGDAYAQARLGVLLLERDDAAGEAFLREAMRLEPESRNVLLPLVDAYYARTGADDALREDVAEQLRRQRRSDEAIDRIRNTVDGRNLVAHGLDDAALETLRETLASHGKVKKAWLVRRDLGADASVPHFVLLVAWRGMLLGSEEKQLRKIVDALQVPGTIIVCTAPHRRWIAHKIRKACGKPTYHHR
ncbi:Zn-dependent protease with chaperone function [Lysobacter dokdonensis DS-58]|uniref:Zn-dependent protease with chaperone function n=1 Tax=Lysobacter dokdonensis DS-58 TaxID=1300345 RepID=A0A0A2WIW9_9GAMM|nr:M48 family metallopeptidase [Lysobacter dokdonensis]KGQ20141.1 Zn-dependent protease with chaperone function [Lysobacter dokdonensis DS-58]